MPALCLIFELLFWQNLSEPSHQVQSYDIFSFQKHFWAAKKSTEEGFIPLTYFPFSVQLRHFAISLVTLKVWIGTELSLVSSITLVKSK